MAAVLCDGTPRGFPRFLVVAFVKELVSPSLSFTRKMYRLLAPLLLYFTTWSVIAANLHVTIPLSSPSGASKLSPSLVSLSIEQDRWVDWAGTSGQNSFFYNTLDNLRQLTGVPPWIRIGADSEDHTNFNPNTQVCIYCLQIK
jgi:hypothetical protein